jgi:hypothetical protein
MSPEGGGELDELDAMLKPTRTRDPNLSEMLQYLALTAIMALCLMGLALLIVPIFI